MTLQRAPELHVIPPPHKSLARMEGRTVTVECCYGNVCWQRDEGTLYYVYAVHVFPSVSCDHLWLDLPMKARKNLYEGTRFSFQGEVIQYRRVDTSFDYGIKYVGGLKVIRG